MARNVFKVLIEDATTGEWLFTNRDGGPLQAIKKGFAAACVRAETEDLRPYDLRHTFATRLVERGVHHFVISALLGHNDAPNRVRLRVTHHARFAHATWDAMVAAVESLEHQPALKPNMFVVQAKEGQPQAGEARKAS